MEGLKMVSGTHFYKKGETETRKEEEVGRKQQCGNLSLHQQLTFSQMQR